MTARLVLIEVAVSVCVSCVISLIRTVVSARNIVDVHHEYQLKISRNPAFGRISCRNALSVRSGKMLAILDTWMLNRCVLGLPMRLFASSKGARVSAFIGSESKPCIVAKYPAPRHTRIRHRISIFFCVPFKSDWLLPRFTPSRLRMICLLLLLACPLVFIRQAVCV